MAFYEKHGQKLTQSVPFPKGNLELDIHKTSDKRGRHLWMEYKPGNYYFSDVFKTQREAKHFGMAFAHGFDAGLACSRD